MHKHKNITGARKTEKKGIGTLNASQKKIALVFSTGCQTVNNPQTKKKNRFSDKHTIREHKGLATMEHPKRAPVDT